MRLNKTFTFGDTPINVHTGTANAPAVSSEPRYLTRVFVQVLSGSVNKAYVMDGIKLGTVPSVATDDHITAELAAAAADAPGGAYSDSDFSPSGGIDERLLWVAGTNGDKIKVSVDYKV